MKLLDKKQESTQLERAFYLLVLSNFLIFLALLFGHEIPLVWTIPVAMAPTIFPLITYLRRNPTQFSITYIALLNLSCCIIFPIAVVGFTWYYGVRTYGTLLLIPLSLFIVLLYSYLYIKLCNKSIIKDILKRISIKRENHTNALNQLNLTGSKSYRNKVYISTFTSLTVLNAITICVGLFVLDDEAIVGISILTYLGISVFMLKKLLPTARLYPFVLYYPAAFLLIYAPYGYFYYDSSETGFPYSLAIVFGLFGLAIISSVVVALGFAVYEIYNLYIKPKSLK